MDELNGLLRCIACPEGHTVLRVTPCTPLNSPHSRSPPICEMSFISLIIVRVVVIHSTSSQLVTYVIAFLQKVMVFFEQRRNNRSGIGIGRTALIRWAEMHLK